MLHEFAKNEMKMPPKKKAKKLNLRSKQKSLNQQKTRERELYEQRLLLEEDNDESN